MGQVESSLLLDIIKQILGNPRKENKTKNQYSFDCPVCSALKDMPEGDGKGNFEVSLSKGLYHCWSCGNEHNTHGSIGKLIHKFGTKEQKLKLKKLGIDIKETKSPKKKEILEIREIHLPEEYIPFEGTNPNTLPYKEAWNYLTKQRNIDPDIIYKYKMGYTVEGEYASRIIVPSYDKDGKLNYFTGRTWLPKKKPKYKNPDLPREEVIFNEQLINWDSTIYIVEGPFDHIVVYNSIPMLGKDLHPKLYDALMKKANSWVVVLLDDDAWYRAKQIYSQLNVGRLHGKVKIIKMRDGFDISQVNEDFGREGVVDVLRSSFKLKESSV
jgi:DNA primase